MAELREFCYEMRSEFDRPIERHSFRLMCLPSDTPRQRVLDLKCEIAPCAWSARGVDGFGNRYVYGLADRAHRDFTVRVRGAVETGLCADDEAGDDLAGLFRCFTPTTAPGPCADAYHREARPEGRSGGLDVALGLMERLHRDISYQHGVSDTTTTSEEVFARRQGVCQDFAHALITLCRMEGLAARYVAGMAPGEGETHAWVEVLSGGRWHALDPTHGRVIDGECIQLARGRDCRDCLVNRGIYFNPALETQKISVNVSVKA